MPTLTYTRGLPGSGKTTWAKTQPGIRVNRDGLRAMLIDPWPYGDDDAEMACTIVQFRAIRGLLEAGYDVICDDTNLLIDHVRQLHELVEDLDDVVIESHSEFMDVPIGTCIARDALRSAPVGEATIRRMWQQHLDELDLI